MNKLEDLNSSGDLTKEQIRILHKMAFDTIPLKRRMALQILARFALGSSTAGIATLLEYQTPVVAGWLAQLNALGICKRSKTFGSSDKWFLKDEYKDIMVRFEEIKIVDEALESVEDKEDIEQSWGEQNRAIPYDPRTERDDFEKTQEEIEFDKTISDVNKEISGGKFK